MSAAAGYVVDLRPDESVILVSGPPDSRTQVVVTMVHKTGRAARLRINAPGNIKIAKHTHDDAKRLDFLESHASLNAKRETAA